MYQIIYQLCAIVVCTTYQLFVLFVSTSFVVVCYLVAYTSYKYYLFVYVLVICPSCMY